MDLAAVFAPAVEGAALGIVISASFAAGALFTGAIYWIAGGKRRWRAGGASARESAIWSVTNGKTAAAPKDSGSR